MGKRGRSSKGYPTLVLHWLYLWTVEGAPRKCAWKWATYYNWTNVLLKCSVRTTEEPRTEDRLTLCRI